MFCTNCGKQIDDRAVVCVGCGVPVRTAHQHCASCGNALPPQAAVCTTCGVPVQTAAAQGGRSKVLAGILGIIIGTLGIHNFYLGFIGKGLAQLLITVLSFGILSPVCAIWGLIEGIMILTGSINRDAQGRPLSE